MKTRRVRWMSSIVALLAGGGLLAGCQGSATPAATPGAVRTVATVSPTQPPSATTSASSTVKHSSTLPACGALRDPFDPGDTPPPARSPARC